jgi:hypothetical protein
MTPGHSGDKGLVLEELLRAYFLRAGFFVVRGVPVMYGGEDLTDIDLYLYERPTGAARRIQIVDIKYKKSPKAVERVFWTRGLIEVLGVDGAYVATTDKRGLIRKIADKVDIAVLDGTDLERIRESPHVLYPERITDEDLVSQLQVVDKGRKDRALTEARKEILCTLSEGLGLSSLVPSLGCFSRLATLATTAYPNSAGAVASGRLAYLSGALACAALDHISVGAAFRSAEEKKELLLNAIRFGAADSGTGMQNLRLAMALIEEYAPGGANVARQVQTKLMAELNAIPAEIVADQAGRLLKENSLFGVARELEASSYRSECPSFDDLGLQEKGMIGAFLDYAGVRRDAFASAWSSKSRAETATPAKDKEPPRNGMITMKLFS